MEKLEPTHLKGRILLWADLSHSNTDAISKAPSVTEIQRILCDAMHIGDPEPRRGVLLELYSNVVFFCRERTFNREQTSVLLSIVKNMHQLNAGTPLNNMDRCFTYCSELLLTHSVRRPPFSIDLFNIKEVTEILKYVVDTYMRNYSLYKYIFTPQMYLDLSLSYDGLQEEPEDEEPARSEEEEDDKNGLHEEPGDEEPASSGTEEDNKNEVHPANEDGAACAGSPPAGTDDHEPDVSSKAALRTVIQKEVEEEVTRLTARLEERLRERTDRLDAAFDALETKLGTKKVIT